MVSPARPGLRLMIYDRTCRGRGPLLGLTHSWIAGGLLYTALGRLDGHAGFDDWSSALAWLAEYPFEPISEIQIWSHGKWGCALMGPHAERLDVGALDAKHEWHARLAKIRDKLCGPETLWWFRTCETLGGDAGHEFAVRWSNFFGARVAGHTHIIGPWQSGLQCVEPGAVPDWSPTQGLIAGTPSRPRAAANSGRNCRHTITCLHGRVPEHVITRASVSSDAQSSPPSGPSSHSPTHSVKPVVE